MLLSDFLLFVPLVVLQSTAVFMLPFRNRHPFPDAHNEGDTHAGYEYSFFQLSSLLLVSLIVY